jgi:glycosyltransferase involved in cell wall biosynthesis
MRVALMTSAKGWRGSGASYAKLTDGLMRRGHQAELITTAPGLTARFEAEGLPVTLVSARNTGPREVGALTRTLRRLRAQAVLVDTPRDLRLAAWARLFQPARIVYRYNLNYRPARGDWADRLYARRIDACIYQSRFIEEDALRQQPWIARASTYRIPNGYDTTQFAPAPADAAEFRRRWDIAADAEIVLTAAKLERNKGHEVAIPALSAVQQNRRNVIYVVCGDGSREAELRALAAGLGLPTRFTGLLGTGELIAAMSAADLVLHPSLQEIFPNAVGEAMSCGCAVVAVDAGGTGELLGRDGSTGVLVPPGDESRMVTEVHSLLRDPARRASLGAAARRRIAKDFPLDRMITEYEAALQRIIGSRG